MVVANFEDKGIQQSHTTNKEMTFNLSLSFQIYTLSRGWKLKLVIHRIKIRNGDCDRIPKYKFIYEKR